jgi:hypothetical protein
MRTRLRVCRAGRDAQRGSIALLGLLVSVIALLGTLAVAEVWVARSLDERAQTLADVAAHAAVVAAGPHADDLSVELQADPEACHFQAPPSPAPRPGLWCARVMQSVDRVLQSQTGAARVLDLILHPDLRDMAPGVGTGRIGAIAVVALPRSLPGCAAVPPPATLDARSICWAEAISAAQQT